MIGLQSMTIHRSVPQRNQDGSYMRDEHDEIVYTISDIPARGRVRPTSAREITSGRQTLTVDAVGVIKTVNGQKATDDNVHETDELTAGGKRYRVAGRFFVESEGGALDHVRADLRAVE